MTPLVAWAEESKGVKGAGELAGVEHPPVAAPTGGSRVPTVRSLTRPGGQFARLGGQADPSRNIRRNAAKPRKAAVWARGTERA